MSKLVKRLTSSAAIDLSSGREYLGVVVKAGSDEATVSIYNDSDGNTAANKMDYIEAAANGYANNVDSSCGVYCRNGIYAAITGNSPEVWVHYR